MVSSRLITTFDAFRTVPRDLAEASVTGAIMTAVAFGTCLVLFCCEVTAFLSAKPRTDIALDSNEDSLLRINFDVQMLDMSCDYVTVGVWDAFGTERMNITKNIQKQRIDHSGREKGHPYTEDELLELEFSNTSFTKEELAELDSDWSSSSDQFDHDDFQKVVDAHAFTFVNFYADWCPHCQLLAPTWSDFESKVNDGREVIKDADGVQAEVRVLKINCVDFQETCVQQRIQGFPTIRLYRRGKSEPSEYMAGAPDENKLLSFAREEVARVHLRTGSIYHYMFREGCRVRGRVEVARVPGTLHFQAVPQTREKTMNFAFTNVSHIVHSLIFGDALQVVPQEYRKLVNPLAGRSFVVDKFHLAPHHYIKVVNTRFENGGVRSYQLTHQWHTQTVQRKIVPQAKFYYDLAPIEVIVRKSDRRWYDFITSIFAIIGGTFTVMSMTSGAINFTNNRLLKASVGKLG